MYENRARRGVTYAGLAVQPVPAFSIGGGVSLFANCKGKFTIPIHVKDREVPAPEGSNNEPLDVASDLTLDFPYTYSPYAGVFVRPTEWLRLGATYRGPFEWDVKVAVDAELYLENYRIDLARLRQLVPGLFPLKGVVEFYSPALGNKPLRVPLELEGLEGKVTVNATAPVQMLAEMADHWKPHEIALGGSAQIGDQWTVTSDVTWQGWSQYPAPDLHLSIDDINVDISTLPASLRARIRTLTVPVLGTVGPLPPVQLAIPGLHTRLRLQFPMKETIKPKTHDIFIPRLGVEHRFPPIEGALWVGDMQFAVRGGYSYQSSPFEPQRGYVNLVDSDKHVMTAGFGVTFNRKISFDVYGECHYLEPVTLEKDLVDPDYPFDRVQAGGYMLSSGASVAYHW
jgi:hypothetical protein